MKDDPKLGWEHYRESVKKLPRTKGTSPKHHAKNTQKNLPSLKTNSQITPTTIPEVTLASRPPSTRKLLPLDHDENFSFLPKLDRAREKQLRAGTLPIEAKIDLHGMRQNEAYEALQDFLATQISRGRRHVLVITGKGLRQQGVLRHQLPLWLKTMPEGRSILRICHAAPRHGGEGAYYILFKNPKKPLKHPDE